MSTQLQQAMGQQQNPFAPQPPINLGMSNADLLGALEGRFVAPLGPLSYFRGQQIPQALMQGGIQPLPAAPPRAMARPMVGTGNPYVPQMPGWRR